MRKFEFVLRKIIRQRALRIWIVFFALMIPGHAWRVFMELLLFSGLLPREIERKEDETVLQFPIKRHELFLYEFLAGGLFIAASLLISASLSRSILPKVAAVSLLRDMATTFYVYSLSALCARFFKSAFALPLVILILDGVFCSTPWRYISPVCVESIWGFITGLVIFVAALMLYGQVSFKEREERI